MTLILPIIPPNLRPTRAGWPARVSNISHLVSFRITPDIKRQSSNADLASGESASTSTDGSLVFRLKYAFGQVNFDQWTTKDTWIRIGE